MEYTGTGTLSDTYIVDNYTDLRTVCAATYSTTGVSGGKYIELDNSNTTKIMDVSLDSAYKLGVDEILPLYNMANNDSYTYLNGNGWTIRNVRSKVPWNLQNTHFRVSDLNILNSIVSTNTYTAATSEFPLLGCQNTSSTMTNCSISYLVHSQRTYGYAINNIKCTDCSFYLYMCDTTTGQTYPADAVFNFVSGSTRNNIEIHNFKLRSGIQLVNNASYVSLYGDFNITTSSSTAENIFGGGVTNSIAALSVNTDLTQSSTITIGVDAITSSTNYIVSGLPITYSGATTLTLNSKNNISVANAKSESYLINLGFLP